HTTFVSSHLDSMSLHLDNERISLTSLSPCGIILRKSARKTQKKEKSLSPDVSVIRRQSKKGRTPWSVALLASNEACAPALCCCSPPAWEATAALRTRQLRRASRSVPPASHLPQPRTAR